MAAVGVGLSAADCTVQPESARTLSAAEREKKKKMILKLRAMNRADAEFTCDKVQLNALFTNYEVTRATSNQHFTRHSRLACRLGLFEVKATHQTVSVIKV